MNKPEVQIDELKQWKDRLETAHKKWKDGVETEQNKLISYWQLQWRSLRESKDVCG